MNLDNYPELPFWQGCLQLLYWVFFKPLTLGRYIHALEPDLPGDYSLWQARRRLRANRRLRQALWQALLVTLLVPWPLAALAALITGPLSAASSAASPIDWGGVALGVAIGVAFGVAAGVALGVAFGVAAGVAFGVAAGVAIGVAFGVAFGVAGGVVVGVAGGVAAGVALGVGAGVALGVTFGVTLGVAIGVTFGVTLGVAFGVTFGVAFVAGYLRLFLYLPQVLVCVGGGLAARLRPAWAPRLARLAPPLWDELIWFPLPGMVGLARQAARLDFAAGLNLAAGLLVPPGTRAQGRRALADISADLLGACRDLHQALQVPARLDFLPQDLRSIRPDLAEMLPALLAMLEDLQAIEQSGSLLSRRLALRNALEGLNTLHGRLPFLSVEARERWAPVLQQWSAIFSQELNRLSVGGGGSGLENPYEPGNPLQPTRKELFKGRGDLRNAVAEALRQRSRVTLALTGPRRMGKTSFLLQLPALLPGSVIPAFVDLQRPAHTASDAAFLYAIAQAVQRDAQPYRILLPAPQRAAFERSPFESFERWLDEQALPGLQSFTVLLAFDEFEKAGQALAQGRLSSQVLDELRHIIQHSPQIALLFAGVQTLDELGPQWSSYFVNVRALTIGYLQATEAEELVRHPDPGVEFNLSYTDEAAAHILAQTRCHPYLIQLVCSCIVEQANAQKTDQADLALVGAGLSLALERGEPYFRNVWDEMAGPEGCELLRQVAAASHPLPLSPEDLPSRKAIERMLRLKVLSRSEQGYTVDVPLVQRWVNERAPV